jgi:CHASE2 domain-containing sensor protein
VKAEARKFQIWAQVRTRLKNKAVIGIFLIVTAWNVALSFDWGRQHFPLALSTQLKFYDWLWSWKSEPRYDSTVTFVRIDDSLHWAQDRCDSPTSRHLLAQLISSASQHKAAVIALDVQLFAPFGKAAGWHNPGRKDEDDELLRAIHDAARLGVTVVLPVGFVSGTSGGLTRIPNVYRDEELPLADDKGKCGYPACAVLGSIRLPVDKRQIPLQEVAKDWYIGSPVRQFPSFALAAADAQSRAHVQPSSKPLIAQAIRDHEEVFGGFLPESAFTKHEVPAQQLENGEGSELWRCNGSLVLIGGEWHSDQGYGPLEDLHLSPVGEIPGLVLHANYMEALLGDHFTKSLGFWWAVVIDVFVGLALYVAFDSVRTCPGMRWLLGQFLVLLLAIIPIGFAYVSFVNFGKYFDFILPIGLYFVHLLYEHLKEYVRLLMKMMGGAH